MNTKNYRDIKIKYIKFDQRNEGTENHQEDGKAVELLIEGGGGEEGLFRTHGQAGHVANGSRRLIHRTAHESATHVGSTGACIYMIDGPHCVLPRRPCLS